jgi:hypothetical protein
MATMRAPQGVTQVSVEQQNFQVKPDGTVAVPDNFVAKLKEIGFQEVAQRIAVSPEAQAQIAAAAAKLNLPEPQLTRVVDKPVVNVKPSVFPSDDTAKDGQAISTEPAAATPGAPVPHPEAGATGNAPTISQAQLKDAGV